MGEVVLRYGVHVMLFPPAASHTIALNHFDFLGAQSDSYRCNVCPLKREVVREDVEDEREVLPSSLVARVMLRLRMLRRHPRGRPLRRSRPGMIPYCCPRCCCSFACFENLFGLVLK